MHFWATVGLLPTTDRREALSLRVQVVFIYLLILLRLVGGSGR